MNKISEREFAEICDGIFRDREIIRRHNPIGTPEETLLWMLLSCLFSYLSLTELETPCFTGKPTAEVYRTAISFVLKNKKAGDFNEQKYLDRLNTE